MKTYDELIQELEDLQKQHYQDEKMDGSGDCSGIISEHYQPLYDEITNQLNKIVENCKHEFEVESNIGPESGSEQFTCKKCGFEPEEIIYY